MVYQVYIGLIPYHRQLIGQKFEWNIAGTNREGHAIRTVTMLINDLLGYIWFNTIFVKYITGDIRAY
jgi:hypothetical protein